jgi:hypothetical protein
LAATAAAMAAAVVATADVAEAAVAAAAAVAEAVLFALAEVVPASAHAHLRCSNTVMPVVMLTGQTLAFCHL